MSNNILDNNINNNINNNENIKIEPTIITNSYYDNYNKNNLNNNQYTNQYTNQNNNIPTTNYQHNITNSENKNTIFNIFKKILILMNIENNFIKIFGIDKLIIPLLILLKIWITHKIPMINKYIFREKVSSLTITYTHFTSTYYNQQNNSSDYLIYKSILNYVYDKHPIGCKFSTNPNGNLMFFEQFDEIQLNKNICIISKVTITTTSSIYILEILSYNSPIIKINKFIKHCLHKYKDKIQKDNLGTSAIKYYKYIGFNNSSHQAIYDEYNFIPTKRFDNIFFRGKDKFVENINYFANNKDAYRELGIPYSLGILLYGPVGTGKTSCMKAVASMLKRHLIDVSLSRIKSQKELREIFYGSKINGNECDFSKRIYVLDELDAILDIIKDRKLKEKDKEYCLHVEDDNLNQNKSNTYNKNIQLQNSYNQNNFNRQSQQISNNNNDKEEFDGVRLEDLLTIMDGCVEQDGPIFIATTNYIELIDKALKRPGRFDICLNLDNADNDIIEQIIEHFGKKHTYLLDKKFKHKHFKLSSSKSKIVNKFNRLTDEQKYLIKKNYKYEWNYIWSPATISQICLFNIDNTNYYESVIQHIVNNYEEQCKSVNNYEEQCKSLN